MALYVVTQLVLLAVTYEVICLPAGKSNFWKRTFSSPDCSSVSIPSHGLSSGIYSQCLSGQVPASPTSPCPAVPICPVVSSVCNQAGFVVSW